jgi:FemAB-related protein (PEP-CTERM system-associated)
VLPLVELKTRLFGHFMVSLPFFDYAGILADDAEAEAALGEAAVALARRTGARHIELRQAGSLGLGWTARRHKVALVVPLSADPTPLWAGLSSRLRGKVRKAEKAGARCALEGPEGLAGFYSVFARNMRDLGTPVYPLRLFQDLLAELPHAARLFVVRRDGRPVAGALGLLHRDRLELPWICADHAGSRDYVNELLYWSVIRWSCEQRLAELDLGRSTVGSGPHRFKAQWKPLERPLHWYYWSAPGTSLPQLNPDNPRYRLAIGCWRRLPLRVANALGPRIVRGIP